MTSSEDRDKSSKRKSNLNRSLTEEATNDCDEASSVRRRRRRELGAPRQAAPADDGTSSSRKSSGSTSGGGNGAGQSSRSHRSDLAYHMENARRGLDLPGAPINTERRRSGSSSTNSNNGALRQKCDPATAASGGRACRRSDTLPLGGGELRKQRSNDVNRKLNERTKSDLAEIMKIAAMATNNEDETAAHTGAQHATLQAQQPQQRESSPAAAILDLTNSINRIRESHERELTPQLDSVAAAAAGDDADVFYTPENRFTANDPDTASGGHKRHQPRKLSPILRRRSSSSDEGATPRAAPPAAAPTAAAAHAAQNHIVSILKKNSQASESVSASSNASPVTFSASVVDTPTKHKRGGILKKRSSLDESRYYSRSHSPDERSILTRSMRRNSLEEIAAASPQHGILKQSSYDSSKSDGCPSAAESHPHGILKKKDSTSTPSEGGSHTASKHVSISQAVTLAAAELGREKGDAGGVGTSATLAALDYYEEGCTPSNEEYEIRPILKQESSCSDDAVRQPKPILKKKSSGDSDEHEIRPILKTSRKSSREEFELGAFQCDEMRHLSEPSVRPILKTESPSKRRSLGDETQAAAAAAAAAAATATAAGNSPSLLKRRTRSLERQTTPVLDLGAALDAIASANAAQTVPVEFVSTPITLSVAERIKSMERYLSTQLETTIAGDTMPKLIKPSAIRRELRRDRFRTQPITDEEKNALKISASPLGSSTSSAFKSTDTLNYVACGGEQQRQQAQSLQSQLEPVPSTEAFTSTNFVLARSASHPVKRLASAALETPQVRTRVLSGQPALSFDDSASNTTTNTSVCGNSLLIFEMSESDEDALLHKDVPSEGAPPPDGVPRMRANSVRARANMFQQLQEQNAATTKTNSAIQRRAAGPLVNSPMQLPQLNSDDEIEPSSLPLSERLRFFSNLSDSTRQENSFSVRTSPFSSIERCTSLCSYTPDAFAEAQLNLSDRNNNNQTESLENGADHRSRLPLKKIGKIKSVFIENCQQQQQQQKLEKLESSKYMKYNHKSSPNSTNSTLTSLENFDTDSDANSKSSCEDAILPQKLDIIETRKPTASKAIKRFSRVAVSGKNGLRPPTTVMLKYGKYFGLDDFNSTVNSNCSDQGNGDSEQGSLLDDTGIDNGFQPKKSCDRFNDRHKELLVSRCASLVDTHIMNREKRFASPVGCGIHLSKSTSAVRDIDKSSAPRRFSENIVLQKYGKYFGLDIDSSIDINIVNEMSRKFSATSSFTSRLNPREQHKSNENRFFIMQKYGKLFGLKEDGDSKPKKTFKTGQRYGGRGKLFDCTSEERKRNATEALVAHEMRLDFIQRTMQIELKELKELKALKAEKEDELELELAFYGVSDNDMANADNDFQRLLIEYDITEADLRTADEDFERICGGMTVAEAWDHMLKHRNHTIGISTIDILDLENISSTDILKDILKETD